MAESPGTSSVTVVLPTIGRAALVADCLGSLEQCTPRADEILVIDSSSDGAVADIVASFAHIGAQVVSERKRGLGYAFNAGLRAASHDVVLLTNDDCVVDPTWVGVGNALLARDADVIVTGRVLPEGDSRAVPSTIDDPVRREHSGRPAFVLYTQSMALMRSSVLAFGAFDGRISPSAEDNDLSYRWLRAGRRIRYEPDFLVWHRDWRSADQLSRLYVDYGVGQGLVYAKHLLRGDVHVARFVARDSYAAARGLVDRAVRGRRMNGDWRVGLAQGLPVGLLRGLREYRGSQTEGDE